MSRSLTLLLTATIAPKGAMVKELKRSDPLLRLEDYKAALRFWINSEPPWLAGIVFADNSGFSLASLREEMAKINTKQIPIEFLSFDFPPPPEGLHYGYSEYLLIRAAVEKSSLIARGRFFIKATGRYTFPNIDQLVRSLPEDFKIAIDCRTARPFTRRRHFLAQTALALFEKEFFLQRIADLPEKMVPAPPWTRQQFIETMLFDRLAPMSSEKGVILRWPCNCETQGVGANGDNYSGLKKQIQGSIRSIGRVVAPGFWI